MKKSVFLGVILVTSVAFVACNGVDVKVSENKNDGSNSRGFDVKITESSGSASVDKPVANLHDGITAFDDDWNMYRSQTKEYSLKVPKMTRIWSCASKDGYEMVTVGVFGSQQYDYVAPKEFYVSPEKDHCEKVETTFDSLEGKNAVIQTNIPNWKVIVEDAKDDQAIDAFIKKVYGKGCSMADKTVNGKGSIADVGIKTTGPDEPENKLCFINWITELKYDATFGKIAKWDIGQDSNFYDEKGNELDTKMAGSFLFDKNL